eukprot:scaffold245208_cov19-Prasinocladus_malaysianus.AAC.1
MIECNNAAYASGLWTLSGIEHPSRMTQNLPQGLSGSHQQKDGMEWQGSSDLSIPMQLQKPLWPDSYYPIASVQLS